MKKEVYCPNCATPMFKPEGLAIMECPACNHRYYIILTSIQKKKEIDNAARRFDHDAG